MKPKKIVCNFCKVEFPSWFSLFSHTCSGKIRNIWKTGKIRFSSRETPKIYYKRQ